MREFFMRKRLWQGTRNGEFSCERVNLRSSNVRCLTYSKRGSLRGKRYFNGGVQPATGRQPYKNGPGLAIFGNIGKLNWLTKRFSFSVRKSLSISSYRQLYYSDVLGQQAFSGLYTQIG
jgi:hypothetical protein